MGEKTRCVVCIRGMRLRSAAPSLLIMIRWWNSVKLLRKSLSRQDLSAAHQSGPAAAVAASSRTMPMVVNCVCHGPWLGDPGTKCSPPLHPGWKVALTGVEIKRVLDVMHTTGELFLKAARTSVPTFMPTYGAQAQFMGDYLHAFVRAARAEMNMEHEEVESCDLWDNLVRISKSHGDTVRSWLSRVNHHGLTPTTCGGTCTLCLRVVYVGFVEAHCCG